MIIYYWSVQGEVLIIISHFKLLRKHSRTMKLFIYKKYFQYQTRSYSHDYYYFVCNNEYKNKIIFQKKTDCIANKSYKESTLKLSLHQYFRQFLQFVVCAYFFMFLSFPTTFSLFLNTNHAWAVLFVSSSIFSWKAKLYGSNCTFFWTVSCWIKLAVSTRKS